MSLRYLTVTTISAPNRVLELLAEGAARAGVAFVVAGDTKTPPHFSLAGCRYLSIEEQEDLFPRFCSVLPVKHYCRKNTAYLAAVRAGAEWIQETDDDNIPEEGFFSPPPGTLEVTGIESATPWFNAYAEFSEEQIWPRGLPLQHVRDSSLVKARRALKVRGYIRQGLADDNPDVDAVYRMIFPLPLIFKEAPPIMLERGSWCPFNSQNTQFRREVFPLLYLPSRCSFRMTDIWRSLVAQRCLWEMGEGVVFHAATVRQERNEHSLLRDFEEEVPGYLLNEKIRQVLEATRLPSADCRENLLSCYAALVSAQLIPEEEMPILRAWCDELA